MLKTVPVFATFRIYPRRDRYHYFTVYVFPSRRDMRTYRANMADVYPGEPKDWEAMVVKWTEITIAPISGLETLGRDLGAILFHRQKTGTGIVSHEMLHAAVHTLSVLGRLTGLQDKPEVEEDLAWTVGHLTRQFFVKY